VRSLTAAELIEAWGRAYGQSLPRQALALLAAACPEWDMGWLARLTVGQRDGLLLALREWTFGPHVEGYATCPQCGEAVEMAFDVADVRVSDGPPAEDGPPGPFVLAVDGHDVTFRAPDSTDLLALAAAGDGRDAEAAAHALFERCVLSVTPVAEPEAALAVYGAVDAALEDVDPQADIELALQCPACRHGWQAPFDIELFFWNELTTWAQRTLYQVHVLASAYGWREDEILALPAWRRQFYLEMVGG
jgi:hypothetical protein